MSTVLPAGRGDVHAPGPDSARASAVPACPALEPMLARMPLQRRRVRARRPLFHAGQPQHALFYVHAGCFKTCLVSRDGREKITGFRMRGDLLGLDSLGLAAYTCDAVALDVGEVWELPGAGTGHAPAGLQQCITAMLSGEIRRDWNWMLATGTLGADQLVATFLLDLAARLAALGFSQRSMLLRMTRADIGNFLGLTLETVARALSRLQQDGLISVDRREIRIEDTLGLHALAHRSTRIHWAADTSGVAGREVPRPRIGMRPAP